ncbi:cell division protein ZapA [candidate division KSB1 bacterium]|nr:cell division protein ZapA [candidate division KSB1 bacterium]
MNGDRNILKVNIFGTDYPLKVSSDVEYVNSVARFVDTKMKEIHSVKPNLPLHQIAILAALNIADEMFQNKKIAKKKNLYFEENIHLLTKKLELGIKKLTEEQK